VEVLLIGLTAAAAVALAGGLWAYVQRECRRARARLAERPLLYRAEARRVKMRRGIGLTAQWSEGRLEVLVSDRDAVLVPAAQPRLPIWLRRPGEKASGLVLADAGHRRDEWVVLDAPRARPPWRLEIDAPQPWRLIEALDAFLTYDPERPPYR
jgi:hypothetical protein